MIGGPRIDLAKFRAGWMLINFGKAHYYRRVAGFHPICGASQAPMLRDGAGFVANEPGGFPLCKNCLRKIAVK